MHSFVPSDRVYPIIPSEEGPDQQFRLAEVARLRKCLEDERDKRAALYKKYRRGANSLDAVDSVLLTACMGLGIGGVGLLSTIVAAPIVLALEIGALVCGALGVAGKLASRQLAMKVKKHDELRVLAESKLNTIMDHVSAALQDGRISDVEFRLVVDEVAKYHQMKKDIRAKVATALDAETKKSLILKGRDEARAEFSKLMATFTVPQK